MCQHAVAWNVSASTLVSPPARRYSDKRGSRSEARERHGEGGGGGGGRVGASTKEGARTAYELRDEQQPATQTGFESYLYATRLPISGLTST